MDIIQLQLKNLVEPDGFDQRDGLPHGNPRPIDCVLKGMELSGYEEAVREQEDAADSRYRIGVGMAVAAHGNGVFGVRPDTTGVIIKMNEDGTAVMFTGVSDMGNGSVTTRPGGKRDTGHPHAAHRMCPGRHRCNALGYGELFQQRYVCELQRSVKGCRSGENRAS